MVGGEIEGLDFGWLEEGPSWTMAAHGKSAYSVTAFRSSTGDRVAALIPLDYVTAAALSGQWGSLRSCRPRSTRSAWPLRTIWSA